MPPNMKMPIIKVTPSSPSPDPNHPDYPEFFEDKLYLGEYIPFILNLSYEISLSEHVSKAQADIESEVSLDSFTLALDPDDSDEASDEALTKTDKDQSDINLCFADKSSLLIKRNQSSPQHGIKTE